MGSNAFCDISSKNAPHLMMGLINGDVDGKIALLRRDLSQIRYPTIFDEEKAKRGVSVAILPIISFVLHKLSRHVAAIAAAHQIVGRRGKRYLESVFKLAREHFGMKIVLTSSQFLTDVSLKYWSHILSMPLTRQLLVYIKLYPIPALSAIELINSPSLCRGMLKGSLFLFIN